MTVADVMSYSRGLILDVRHILDDSLACQVYRSDSNDKLNQELQLHLQSDFHSLAWMLLSGVTEDLDQAVAFVHKAGAARLTKLRQAG